MPKIYAITNYTSAQENVTSRRDINYVYHGSSPVDKIENLDFKSERRMTEIEITNPRNFIEKDRCFSNDDENLYASDGLNLERKQHISKSEERKIFFTNILSNTQKVNSGELYLIQGIGAIVGCVVITSIYTLIPVHNLFENPKYWYEFPMAIIVALYPNWALMVIFRCSNYMNITYIKNLRSFLTMWSVGSAILLTLYGMQFLVWHKWMGFNYPVPLNGYITACAGMITFYTAICFQFPKTWRRESKFKRRLMSFVLAMGINQALVIQYAIITFILLNIDTDFQWIAALFLPFIREVNILISLHFARKASDGDLTSVEATLNHAVGTTHALFLSYTLGSVATFETGTIILAGDFITNVLTCLWLVYTRLKKPMMIDKQIALARTLVINEMVEFMVPIAYLLCFTVAFYGPNAELFGNVKSSYWHYSAVEDVTEVIEAVLTFFTIDFGSTLISFLVLWKCCKINLGQVYLAVQKDYGIVFSNILVTNLSAVRITIVKNLQYIEDIMIFCNDIIPI